MPDPSARFQRHERVGRDAYEKRDANAKWIFGAVAFLLIAGLLMHLVLAGVDERLAKHPVPTDSWSDIRMPVKLLTEGKVFPRLQLSPPEDLKHFREIEEDELNTYGWINRTAG